MERVRNDQKASAESLMTEAFGKMDDGSFNPAYLAGFVPKLAGTLKPEFMEEAKEMLTKSLGGASISGLAGNVLGGIFGGGKDA